MRGRILAKSRNIADVSVREDFIQACALAYTQVEITKFKKTFPPMSLGEMQRYFNRTIESVYVDQWRKNDFKDANSLSLFTSNNGDTVRVAEYKPDSRGKWKTQKCFRIVWYDGMDSKRKQGYRSVR